jgi:hypothetical protein
MTLAVPGTASRKCSVLLLLILIAMKLIFRRINSLRHALPPRQHSRPAFGAARTAQGVLQRQDLTSDIPANRAAGWVLIRPRVLGVLPGASEYRAHQKQLLVAIYTPFIKSLSVIGVTMRCALHHRSRDNRLLQFHGWVEKKTSWGRLQWTRKGTGGFACAQ